MRAPVPPATSPQGLPDPVAALSWTLWLFLTVGILAFLVQVTKAYAAHLDEKPRPAPKAIPVKKPELDLGDLAEQFAPATDEERKWFHDNVVVPLLKEKT